MHNSKTVPKGAVFLAAEDFCKRYKLDWHAIRNCGQIFIDPPDREHDDWWNYFDMDTDYDAIKKELEIESDVTLRILRQPFVPCVISFVISANNNIKRISKIIEKIDFAKLEKYSVDDFEDIGCGYRSKHLYWTVRHLKNLDFAELAKMSNEELHKTLCTISGVGPKVANCVMLFAFHRLDVVPIDVHIRRVKDKIPAGHRYAGVAQQYLFYEAIQGK